MTRRNRTDRQAALHAGEQTLHGVPGIRELAQDRRRLGSRRSRQGVKGTDRPSRSSNGAPISDSSFRICCERAKTGRRLHVPMPAFKPPMRATAQK